MSKMKQPRLQLPTEEILSRGDDAAFPARVIGQSRQRRPIEGAIFGDGPARVSLLGGCHADEPIGPVMLRRLAAYLATVPGDSPLLRRATWYVVPHINPDGETVNAKWTPVRHRADNTSGTSGKADEIFDLGAYLRHVVRELPGDDIEFGFPRDENDADARPENRAVADFLRPGGPFALHASFHGMSFAPGAWFLIEAGWIERTATMRINLRRAVRSLGYRVFDVDRKGEKGFTRIDSGFTTRPDSGAMRKHFLELDDAATAKKFRPSSMEFVRSLGGDPFTFVSELPLFVVPESLADEELRRRLQELAMRDAASAAAEAERMEIQAMPIGDQMRLQLAFLNEALSVAL